MNTCGHNAPRFTDAPRCSECGAYAHEAGSVYKVPPSLKPPFLERLMRRYVKGLDPPRLEGKHSPA